MAVSMDAQLSLVLVVVIPFLAVAIFVVAPRGYLYLRPCSLNLIN
ncbi:hypothetical protein N752_08320 [Desulforamulus aquiferis]|nr:hypothetical protein N752_08320 [Desulforamulus aquiferis]